MPDQEPKDEQWERIRRAFLKAPAVQPSPAFAYQVMEKIEAKQAFDLSAFLRWVFPTLGLMAAALFFLSVFQSDESIAFETAVLKGGSPFSIQEVAADIERDWTGLEAL